MKTEKEIVIDKIKKELKRRIKKQEKHVNTEYMTSADFIILELNDLTKFIDKL